MCQTLSRFIRLGPLVAAQSDSFPMNACQLQALEGQLADSALPPQVGACNSPLPVTAPSSVRGFAAAL